MADVTHLYGGAPTESAVLVNCDQTSIVGDGSIAKPLRAIGLTQSFKIPDPGTGPSLHPGIAIDTITNSGWGTADNSAANRANVAGLDDGAGNVQSSGLLKLTTAQWDVCTGGSGGLTPGLIYFLGTSGGITFTAPTTTGTYATIIGEAVDAETMDIRIFASNGPHA